MYKTLQTVRMKSHFKPPRFLPGVLLLAAALGLPARPALAQREIKNLNGLALTMGSTQRGTTYQAGYGRYLRDKLRLDVALLAEQGPRNRRGSRGEVAEYRAYEIGLGLAPRLAHFGETVFLRVPLQLRTRYERTPPSGGSPDTDGWAFGPSAGLGADVYLADRLALTGEARTAWLFGHTPRRFPRYFSGGLTFFFGM